MSFLFSRNAEVKVNLENINDNAPEFTQVKYHFSVREVRRCFSHKQKYCSVKGEKSDKSNNIENHNCLSDGNQRTSNELNHFSFSPSSRVPTQRMRRLSAECRPLTQTKMFTIL